MTADFSPPPLVGVWTYLEAPAQRHYEWLYSLYTNPAVLTHWRTRGAVPSPDLFARTLWEGVLAQFLILERRRERPFGLVQAYNADLANGTVYLAVLIEPGVFKAGWPLEGVVLFLNYLFETWNLRKVYFETHALNLNNFASITRRFAQEEGRLVGHHYFRGVYHDVVTAAIYREAWEGDPLRDAVLARAGDHG